MIALKTFGALCVLALAVGPAAGRSLAPASAEWLEDLLAQEPTVASGLVKVLGSEQIGDEAEMGQVTVELQYLDIVGQPKAGKARLFMPQGAVSEGRQTPVVLFAHYECDPGGALHWCRQGWTVVTTHENPEHCLGNSYNLDLALIEWVRRLPFVDRTKLAIAGGSAGGYMTLAMAAEAFPVAGASADVPVLNWAYNGGYLTHNAPLATEGVTEEGGFHQSRLPVVFAVLPIALGAQQLFGQALDLPAWRRLSPVSYLDRITCPVSVTYSTADMLVPIWQLSRDHVRPPDLALFPEGFEMSLEAVTADPAMRKTLLEVLPDEQRAVFVVPVPDDEYPVLTAEQVLDPENNPLPEAPPPIDRPWDTDKQWSIVIFDEGPPLPHVGHFKHHMAQGPESFMAHIREAPLAVQSLTMPKLTRLMERFRGELSDSPPFDGAQDGLRASPGDPERAEGPPLMAEGVNGGRPVHRLNFEPLEQLDVVTALLDYADCGPEHAARLQEVYAALPAEVKALGEQIDLDDLRERRETLLQEKRTVTR